MNQPISAAHRPATGMSPADLASLRAMPDCEAVDLLLPDMNGLLRGKRIHRNVLEKIYADGVCLPMSLMGTDITGNTVEATGLGYDIGDEDRICRPVAGSLRPVPWSPQPMAQLLLSMEDGAGGMFAANPREVLRTVLARYAQRGLKPVVAVELEFYLFDPRCDERGRPCNSINPVTGARNHSTQVYYIEDLNDYRGFTDAVAAACQLQSIPADTAVAEYAPGQFEINLKHRDDALQACDDAVYLKRAIKAVAQQHGVQASFMAKPLVDQAGSGMHIHVSVLDGEGHNVFASPLNQPADPLRHAIGGLQHNARDCLLLFAPNANSYRRFVLNAFVPLNDCWGYNNRTVALRIPHSDPANTRIEHRIAGADSNIHLVTAAVLAGMLDGIEQQREPSPPVLGNAYQQSEIRTPYWRQTIDDFIRSQWVGEQLGAGFQHVFGQQKLAEMRRFESHVSDLEYDWYLRSV